VQIRGEKVLAILRDMAIRARLERVSTVLAESVCLSHLARHPRVDVIAEAAKDLEQIGRSPGADVGAAVRGATAEFDCHSLPAYAAIGLVPEVLKELVGHNGVGLAAIRNTGGMRTLDVWSRVMCSYGLLCIVTWNGGPYVVLPHGGLDAFFGTNPLSFGIPTQGAPIIGDFATSEIAFMDLTRARADGAALHVGAGLDASGRTTTDPNDVFVPPDSARLLPMGDSHKGSSLVLLLEVLTGALIGCAMGRRASPVHEPSEFGGLVVAVDPGCFRDPSGFREAVSELANGIRDSRPRPGYGSVRLPGDIANGGRESLSETNIETSSELIVRALAGEQ
jgi:LDH2 family malate/lactate/ureidoglycolate dehydrogenase